MLPDQNKDIDINQFITPVAGTQELVKDLPSWASRWGLLAVALFMLTVIPVMFLIKIDTVRVVNGRVVIKNNTLPKIIVQIDQGDYHIIHLQQQFQVTLNSFPDKEFKVTSVKIGVFSVSKSLFELECQFNEDKNFDLSYLKDGMVGEFVVQHERVSILQSIVKGF